MIPVSFGSSSTAWPSETVIVTSVPLRMRLPAVGSVLITSPASTVSEYSGSADLDVEPGVLEPLLASASGRAA